MKWHYEVIAEYPNGGKDVVKIIDEADPPAPIYASKNYEKGEGIVEGWQAFYAIKNIASGEQLVLGQNVSETKPPEEEGE